MKNILPILLSIILFSCSNNTKRYHVDEIYQNPEGLFYTTDGLCSGIVFNLFDNGNLFFEYTLDHGKSFGVYKIWYRNGQLYQKGFIERGDLTQRECFDTEGTPMKCSYLKTETFRNVIGVLNTKLFKELKEQIKKDSIQLSKLHNDTTLLEKLKREKDLMKKDNGDIIIRKTKSDE